MELLEAKFIAIGIPLHQVKDVHDRANVLAVSCPDTFYIDDGFGVRCLMMRGINMNSTEFKVVDSWVTRGVTEPEA